MRVMTEFIKAFMFEALFWLHIVIWLPVLILTFVASLNYVILFVLLYEMHRIFFKGCIFTKTQQRIGVLPRLLEYYTAISARVFNFRLTGHHVFYITKLTETYLLVAGMLITK